MAVVTLAGCSAGQVKKTPALVTQEAASVKELRLPFDALELSKEENVRVQKATMHLLGRCMNSMGLDLRTPRVHPSKYPKNATVLGWLGAQKVEKYGYRGPADFAAEMSAAARRESRPIVVSAQQMPVFEGTVSSFRGKPVPQGGCDGQMRRRLNGGDTRIAVPGGDPSVVAERALQALEQQASDRARSDDRFQLVVSAWHSCMAKRGYEYADPDAAQGDPRWAEAAGKHVSALEKATAVADRDCRADVNFSGVLKDLITTYETLIIDSKDSPTAALASLLRTRARNAAKVLTTVP
ncbi:hypothetical protein ABZ208_23450 [Streptomyces sp. NPDC006208]|uniref:hypothetical protein n=1 Tax=Streptomyces sp. NPDC006208 TaxID=3156734 RepID=UPI0033BDDC27